MAPTVAASRLKAAASYVLIAVLQLLLLYPLHSTMDLPSWDEALYMGQGEQFLHGGGLGSLASSARSPLGSPFYALLYSFAVRALGTVDSIFFMHYFVKIGVSLALLLFLSTYLKNRLAALLLTMVWVASSVSLNEHVLVYHAALGVFLVALTCLEPYPLAAVSLLYLCTLTRLEYLFPAVALTLYFLWSNQKRDRKGAGRLSEPRPESSERARRNRTFRKPELVAAASVGMLLVFLLLNLSDFNVGGNRTWFAFNQNYSRHEVEAGRFDVNPFIDSNLVIQADFPGAHSLGDAFSTNPKAFVQHVARNVAMLPKESVRVVIPFASGVSLGVMLAGLGAFALAGLVGAGERRNLLRNFTEALRAETLVCIATMSSLLALLPILLVYPQPHHTLILVPFLLFWPGLLVVRAADPSSGRTRQILVAATAVFALGIVLSPKPYAPAGNPRPILAEIQQLTELWPKRPMRLLGLGSLWYASYLGCQKVLPIEPLGTVNGQPLEPGSDNLAIMIDRHHPDVVLINEELLTSKNFNKASLAVLSPTEWTAHPVGRGTFYFRR